MTEFIKFITKTCWSFWCCFYH